MHILLLGLNAAALVMELLAAAFLLFGSGWAGSAATFVLVLALLAAAIFLIHLIIVLKSIAAEPPSRRSLIRLAIAPVAAMVSLAGLYWLIP